MLENTLHRETESRERDRTAGIKRDGISFDKEEAENGKCVSVAEAKRL